CLFLSHAGDAIGHRGEDRVSRFGEARIVFRNLVHRDPALWDLARGAGEKRAQLALRRGVVFDRKDAAIDREARVRGHGVDLGALAATEDAAEVHGRAMDFALGRAPFALRERALVVVEGTDERGHFFERVDALVRERSVRGLAVHDDFEPDTAVVAAADHAAL